MITLLEKKLNNMRLNTKLLTIYYICIMIPTIVIICLFCVIMKINMQNKYDDEIKYTLDSVKNAVESYFYDGIFVMDSIYTNKQTVYNVLAREGNKNTYYENTLEIERYIEQLNLMSSCKSVKLYTESPNVINGMYITRLTDSIVKSTPYISDIKNDKYYTFFIPGTAGQENSIYAVRRLDYVELDGLHYICVDFDLREVINIFNKYSMWNEMYLVNDKGVVFCGLNTLGDTPSGDLNDKDMYKTVPVLTFGKMSIVVLDKKLSIFDVIKNSLLFFILTFVLLVCMTILWIRYTSNTVSRRLDILLKVIKQSENEIFERVDTNAMGDDEIGALALGINHAFEKIEYLINEIYRANLKNIEMELESRNNELKAVYSQVNPHFLFNIMENLRYMSLIKGENETAQTLKNISKFFRKSLEWDRLEITIKEELSFVEEYLAIQNYRFENTLEYTINCSSEAENFVVPKMLIQIFVENACVHGIVMLKETKRITVDVSNPAEKGLLIIVTDNGCGMKQEKIDAILKGNIADKKSHIGISNILKRMDFYYQGRYSLDIYNNEDRGLTVKLLIRGESYNVQSNDS